MRRVETPLPGVCLLEPALHRDERGFLFESYQQRKFEALGITDAFVQDNQSRSSRGTLRGLHYQLLQPQVKLCRVVRGEVLDVVVDIRRGSPTFGRSYSVRLSARNHRQIYIPAGFAHGFAVLTAEADFLYKCGDFYQPNDQYGIAWNDPALAIEWGVEAPFLSPRDQCWPRLADVPAAHLPLWRP